MFPGFVPIKVTGYVIINTGFGTSVLDDRFIRDCLCHPFQIRISCHHQGSGTTESYIDNSLETARQANEQLANIQAEGARILAEAKEKQNAILKEAFAEKEQIIDEAHRKAAAETRLQVEEAARRIREEKEKAIREVRSEIADLSIAIAEKVMKEKISRDKEQQQIIDRLLDEVSFCKS